MTSLRGAVLVVCALTLAACAAGPQRGAATSGEGAGSAPAQTRVLTIGASYELTHLLPMIRNAGSPALTMRVFNAALTLNDDTGSVRPYLAEALPRLNTDTWRVLPDGRMETTYKLRPGLTWQDGQPLEAEDFVFAQRVYTNSSLRSIFYLSLDLLESAAALDPRTLLLRWRAPYPDADNIQSAQFDPLPRHLLDAPFGSVEQDPAGADAFLALPNWKSEYIGAGPYKLVHWEPGSYFEGAAFDGHALGRPKIERVVVQIIPDDNLHFANLLAGSVDWTDLAYEQGLLLQRDWVAAGQGVVRFPRGHALSMWVQQKPDYVGHPGLLDLRVRRALAHSLDRQAVNEGIFEGKGFAADTVVPDTESFSPEVDRAAMHYPLDPRRSEQLMNDAGYTKGRDGFFANAAGEHYRLDFQRINGSDAERVQLILTDAWRRVGFDVSPSTLPAVQVGAGEQRHAFPGLQQKGGPAIERYYVSSEIGTPENRWTGENRAGWSNAEYDRLYESFTTTLDRTERTRQFVQMQRILSEQIPVFFTYLSTKPTAHVAALRGPTADSVGTGTLTKGTLTNWNIHEWEWQ